MSRPTFSLAIPCWGSSRYVKDALRTLAAIEGTGLEVVVSVDPGSPDYGETIAILRTVDDLEFKVIEPKKPLSMAEHYEWCLRNLSGQWVTILGADDGMLPWGLTVARQALSAVPEAEALMFRRAYYFWPGVEADYGSMRISLRTETSIRTVDGVRAIHNVLRGRGEHFDLPQIYTNNFVRSDVVDRIRDASGGRVFHERNPDVYSGVAVSHFARVIARCEVPAFWTGTSPSSMGLKQRQAIVGGLEEARETVRLNFIEKSTATGHDVSREVGDELWLLAQDSPIYVLSAYLKFIDVARSSSLPVVTARRRRKLIVSAFAAAIHRAAFTSHSEEEVVRSDALRIAIFNQGELLDIYPSRILGISRRFAISHALRRKTKILRKAIRDVFPLNFRRKLPKGKILVRDPDVMRTLEAANVYVEENRTTALPAGLELRFNRTRKVWPYH